MLVNDGQFKGHRWLKPETVKLMFTDQLNGMDGSFKFGLGLAINEIKLGTGQQQRKVLQYSWGGYASTDFVIVPSERFFQIFVRQQIPDTHDLAKKQFSIIYDGLMADGTATNSIPKGRNE